MRCTCPLVLLFLKIIAFAGPGTGQVSGRVTDEQQKGIEGASVTLVRVRDSSLFKILVTDKQGSFDLNNVPVGDYRISASAIGYANGAGRTFAVGSDRVIHLSDIQLAPFSAALHQVEVIGKRPLIELRPDRTILNVDASITNLGGTALEVLQKSPGVTVDKDGNISLKGRQGVTLMLDGKPSYLSGPDLAALLGSMSASQLDQIEIMTNPPAKYDAAGNAGIINIRTKKNKGKGFNGSINLGYGQGRYAKTTNSLNLNYRTEKYNLFLNYSSNYLRGFTDLHIMRQYLAPDAKTVTAIFDEPTYLWRKIANNTLKLGIDYNLSRKTVLGGVVSGFISPRRTYGYGIGYLQDPQGVTDSAVQTINDNNNRVRNGAVNLNIRHAFDSTHELSADADYIIYSGRNPQLFINTATHPSRPLDSGQLRGLIPSVITIWSGKADYSQSLNKHLKVEMGWKSSYVTTDNTANYDNLLGGLWAPDYGKTNHFLYRENINALYANFNQDAGKWSFQAGLRFENTNYRGHQLGNPMRKDSSFDSRYNNFFPTVYISYQVDKDNQFTLSTGRRIDRPAYQDLNPFLFYVNQYTYQQGNPFLKPQYTTNAELSHNFKGMLTTTLNYSNTQSYFTQVFHSSGDTTTFSNDNLGRLQTAGLSVSVQLNPTEWWSATGHIDVVYKKLIGLANDEAVHSEGVVV
ncbi:MAG TPA: TonB-dependent receptor, partial [Puia sp.]